MEAECHVECFGQQSSEGSIGVCGFAVLVIFLDRFFGLCAKKRRFFGFVFLLRFADFLFSAFGFRFLSKILTPGYSDLVSDVLFRFFISGFRFLFDLGSSYTPLLISTPRNLCCSTSL